MWFVLSDNLWKMQRYINKWYLFYTIFIF
jgi:hypothetical protein